MNQDSFLAHITENNIFQKLDRIFMITYPLFFTVGLYLFNRYIAHFNITKVTIIFFLMMLLVSMIILKARMLGRDIKEIENLVKKESGPLLADTKQTFKEWKKHKTHFVIFEAVPIILLILMPIMVIKYPINYFQHYSKETYILIVLLYISTAGMLRLISFRNYMNETLNLYQSFVQSKTGKTYIPEFIEYNFKRNIVVAFIISLFFSISSYVLLQNMILLHFFLFALSFWVLFMLGKGLFDAYKWFYKSLEQLDQLRKKVGIIEDKGY